MLKLIKWDLISFIKKNYGVYMGFAAVFILAVLPLGQPASLVFDAISAAYCVFLFFFTLVVSIAGPINWLMKNSAQLELSLPINPWKKLLGKLVCSAIIIAATMLLMKLLELQSGEHGTDMYTGAVSFVQYLLDILVLVSVIMFSYITAKSFSPTRSIAGLITVLITIGIFVLLGYVSYPLMNVQIQQIPISANGYISYPANVPDANGLQTAFSMAISAASIALLFWGSSVLLRKRFERY